MFLNEISQINNGSIVSFIRIGRVFISSCTFAIDEASENGFRVVSFQKEAIGMVSDDRALQENIVRFVERIEKELGCPISNILLSIDEKYINSAIGTFDSKLNPQKKIRYFHIKDLIRSVLKGYSADFEEDVVLDVINSDYVLNDDVISQNPIGFSASKISCYINIISAPRIAVDNVVKNFSEYNFKILDIIPISLCIGSAFQAKNENVLYIRMGSRFTGFCVKRGDYFSLVDNVPFGGDEITKEIANSFSLSFLEAEKFKILLGNLSPSVSDEGYKYFDFHEQWQPESEGSGMVLKKKDIDLLNRIIKKTINRIFSYIKASVISRDVVKLQDLTMVVLAGGVASTNGIEDEAREFFGISAKLGDVYHVEGFRGLDLHDRLLFLPAVGAINYVLQKQRRVKIWSGGKSGIWDRFFFKLSCFFDRLF